LFLNLNRVLSNSVSSASDICELEEVTEEESGSNNKSAVSEEKEKESLKINEEEEKEITVILIKDSSDGIFCIVTDQDIKTKQVIHSNKTLFYQFKDDKFISKPSFNEKFEAFKQKKTILPFCLFKYSHPLDSYYLSKNRHTLKIEGESILLLPKHPAGGYDGGGITRIDDLRIYTATKNRTQLQLASLNNAISDNSLEILNTMIKAVNELDNLLKEVISEIQKTGELFLQKLSFVCRFFHQQWLPVICDFPSLTTKVEPRLKRVREERTNTFVEEAASVFKILDCQLALIKKYKQLLLEASEVGIHERMKLDPIVYLSVEGDRICVLKSTLLQIIPQSQLTIRVASGRWEEPKENLDEDGYVIIDDIEKYVLRKLIQSIRQVKLMKTDNRGIIKVANQKEIKPFRSALDYLLIDNIDVSAETTRF
jgi:hypothetical protein